MLKLEAWLTELEQRYPTRPVKLDLDRIRTVAERLDVTSLSSVVVTVAGTNGKGSTVRALEAIYLAAGYRVGAYTSPHLLTFNERVRLGGVSVSDALLCDAFEQVKAAEQKVLLTYFEFITLAALWIFKHQQLDLVILEVGLGGRLDATNIIDADLAILTTIDFDHEAYLGTTREAIGFEKAGILRANRPFIFASLCPPQTVLENAAALRAKAYVLGREYVFNVDKNYQFSSSKLELTCTHIQLHPEAVSAALMATCLLQERLPVHQTQLEQAVTSATLAGRVQVLSDEVEVIVDVAHNVGSTRRLRAFLQANYPDRAVRAVFSALSDKAIADMVQILSPIVRDWHLACLEDKRAASESQLRSAYLDNKVVWYDDVFSAFIGAKALCQADELVVVFGSFLTVSTVLKGGNT